MFRVLRFTRAGEWKPEIVNDLEKPEESLTVAAGVLSIEYEERLQDVAVAIVDDRGDVRFQTRGFVPLDIEERIWRAVDQPGKAEGEKRRGGEEETDAAAAEYLRLHPASEVRVEAHHRLPPAPNPQPPAPVFQSIDFQATARRVAHVGREHARLAETLASAAQLLRQYTRDAAGLRSVLQVDNPDAGPETND